MNVHIWTFGLKLVWIMEKLKLRKFKMFMKLPFLICDDTILAKKHSQKIEWVGDQYSGAEHDVVAGIGWVNLVWSGIDEEQTIPVDYLW